eukprot:CAMPEP_0119150440 /NCGR_PEP_ID=MMETSP1310-20130426/44801_1 /TAXON_ID=464262 /ORGANISM="Genus nov. species nov., Strain RCC2339" /LENGTH=190 /DNA_ID=CAMNT_0007142635 /DNA_START=1 /DNA_END=570 /DNA_ORIENTATION=+
MADASAWSTKENLVLASAVEKYGEDNWLQVSRALKAHGNSKRPNSFYSNKRTAAHFKELLVAGEDAKNGKRPKPGGSSSGLSRKKEISKTVDRLRQERIKDLRSNIVGRERQIRELKLDILKVKLGLVDDIIMQQRSAVSEEGKRKRVDSGTVGPPTKKPRRDSQNKVPERAGATVRRSTSGSVGGGGVA